MSPEQRPAIAEIVRKRGYLRLEEPIQLASGEWSRYFIDGKAALAQSDDLRPAFEAMLARVRGRTWEFDAVGGLTMGADQFAHVLAVIAHTRWFVVRKEPKGRGTNKLIEGSQISAGMNVLLVDDVVTTGGSIMKAHAAVVETGARVAGVITLVDRGERARNGLADRKVPYETLVTYPDLGIEPVGGPERRVRSLPFRVSSRIGSTIEDVAESGLFSRPASA